MVEVVVVVVVLCVGLRPPWFLPLHPGSAVQCDSITGAHQRPCCHLDARWSR